MTNVRSQKINGFVLEIFGMIIADFQIENKANSSRFFQKIFLVADTKFKVILKMLFLKLSNANISFGKKILMWRIYTTNKALSTIERVQIINKKNFVIAVLDADSKTFVVYIAIQEQKEMPVYSKKQAQIKAQVGTLLFNKTPTEVLVEYSDFSDVFSMEYIVELPKNVGINEHAIKLEEGKQPSFRLIYSLGPVELETLKIYIKTNLANGFIWPSKSPAKTLILFDRKPDKSFHFCVDYWDFNNLIIKH